MSEQPTKRRRGCLFYGCITGAICLVALLIGALIGLQQFRKILTEYTDSQPMPLPAVALSPEQVEQVRQRFETFRDAVRAGHAVSPLELTGDEIDALIASEPDFRPLKGKLFMRIEGDHVTGDISVPMSEVGLPRLGKRFLNATGTFLVSLENGMLRLSAENLSVKGKPVPPRYMQRIRGENLATKVNENQRVAAALSRVQSIQVKDGRLIVVPKPKDSDSSPPK